jgi:hypothetical protein
VAGFCKCGNERSVSKIREEFLTSCETIKFSSMAVLHSVIKVKVIYVLLVENVGRDQENLSE